MTCIHSEGVIHAETGICGAYSPFVSVNALIFT